MKFKIYTLENLYLSVLIILVGLIIATPYLINDGFSIFDEEVMEVVVSALLFGVGFLIYTLYKREIARHQKSLDATLNYIGNLNLQISNIKSIFNSMKKYPESKNEFKLMLRFLAQRALGIVGSEWLLLRIIEINNTKTLAEHFQARGKVTLVRHEISNKNVVDKYCPSCSVVESDQENFDIQVFCVVSKEKVSEDQRILLKAIVNNLAMLYLIFTSEHYKNTREKNNNVKAERNKLLK